MGHMGAAMGHAYAHTWPYMGAYMGHMGAVMGHAYAHTWAIYGSSNGACMRAYMGHIWGLQWGMHARIYGHIWGSPIGRAGRKGIVGNPFPSLAVPTPSLPLPSLLEGKGAGVIPFPSLPYSAA